MAASEHPRAGSEHRTPTALSHSLEIIRPTALAAMSLTSRDERWQVWAIGSGFGTSMFDRAITFAGDRQAYGGCNCVFDVARSKMTGSDRRGQVLKLESR